MNTLDDLGLSPFLLFIEYFCSRFVSLRSELMIIINAEAKKHKADFSKYKITNYTLFKKVQVDNSYGGGRRAFGGGFGGGGRMKVAKKSTAAGAWGGQEDDETDVFQDEVSIEARTQYTDKLMEDIVVQPFLDMIELMTNYGADPKATVQKLKRFRKVNMFFLNT